jgi:tetratricopeptide (TPR) repeat protein
MRYINFLAPNARFSQSVFLRISYGIVLWVIVCGASEIRAGREDMAIFLTPPWDRISYSPEKIISVCTKSLESIDNVPKSMVAMLYRSRGEAHARVHQYKLARDDMRLALKIRKKDIELEAWIAFLTARVGDCSGYSQLETIVQKKPVEYLPYQLLAELQFESGENRKCANSASLALSKYDQPGSYCVRAQAYLALEKNQEALIDLDHCVLDWPSFDMGLVQYLRGIALLRLKRHDKAASAFLSSYQFSYRTFDSLYRAWDIYYYEERYSLCLVISDRLIKLDASAPSAYVARAASACAIGKTMEAIEYAKKAIGIDSDNRAAYIELGIAYRVNHNYLDSIRAFDHALSIMADDAHALAEKAILFAVCRDKKLRDPIQAIKLARQCCDLTKNQDAYCLIAYAIALAGSNDFLKASAVVKEAVALFPSDDKYKRRTYESLLEFFDNRIPFPNTFIR